MKTVIQVILVAAIMVLGYLLYESIMNPIRFNKEKNKRERATIQRLRDIRTAQVAFKAEYGRFTSSFDTLINFVKSDSFSVIKAIGSIPDTLAEQGMTEKEALKQGLIQRDTIKLSVLDSLFYHRYPIDSLRYVPYTNKKEFKLGTNVLNTASGVQVKVFEAKVPYDILLAGLDMQLIINYKEERKMISGYAGLKVGSLTEATNNAGNWE